jgi:hypothetical protein
LTDKEKIKKLDPIDPAKYENVDLDHLVIYAVSQLEEIGADLSFENSVVAAYKLFPKKFSLLGFPEYPATKRVHDCLFRCTFRTKKWLGGKTAQGFIINDRSRKFIKEAEGLISMPSSKKIKAPSKTRRKELIIAELIASPAYKKYIKEEEDAVSNADLCYLLQGTLDSSGELLKKNLESLTRFAEELERHDVSKFLIWLEDRFKDFLNTKRS